MGQHFLADEKILQQIVEHAGLSKDDAVLEVGPGLGALTLLLSERAGRVVAVEKDPALATWLEAELKKQGRGNAAIVPGDILKLPANFFTDLGIYRVAANIPYYLTARLIRKLLVEVAPPVDLILMVQKEVAERITARAPRMNLLALSVQIYGKPEILFSVPKGAFLPPPEVESAVIKISDISKHIFSSPEEEKVFFKIARSAFQGKRKVLINSLAHGLGREKQAIAELLRSAGIALAARPSELSREEWITLTRCFLKLGSMEPR